MNMDLMPHMGGGVGWLGGGVVLLLWVALLASACWLVIRAASPARLVPVRVDRARDLLAERYARGEISTEEYLDRLTHLPSR
ncbi:MULTISPECIES: SHOCT domain-containing protein [Nonomuraea]|jgi:putative membrane protein|uniref:SHOCT domain-containing protein n=1 Tax=Nonomuraea salmonea TaxID=46181 RepID=A0ABV5P299_9ACTN